MLTVEPLGHERPVRAHAQGVTDLLERWPGRWIGSQVTHFPGVVSYVEQFLAGVVLAPNVRPLARVQRPQRPGFVGQAVGVAIERIVRNDFGERGLGERIAPRAVYPPCPAKNWASDSPGNGEPDSRSSTSTIVAARSRRLTVSLTTRLEADATRGNDQERNMQLGLIETRSVAEYTGVLAETLAVIRDDNQPGSIQHAAPAQFVHQLADLLVEVRDAVVISIGGKRDLLRREGDRPAFLTSSQSVQTVGRRSEQTRNDVVLPSGKLVGSMGIGVVQEREERPLAVAAGATASRRILD